MTNCWSVFMVDYIFREYDIRGIVGSELMLEQVYELGQAIACFFKEKTPTLKSVAIGMDGRLHSPEIKNALVAAFQDSGCDVFFVGVCPTPVVYFMHHVFSYDAALMITASHNPATYNGLKICLDKKSVWGGDILTIRSYYQRRASIQAVLRGSYQEIDGIKHYVDYLVAHFSHLKGLQLRVLIDCGNAVGGLVLPHLIQALQWPYVELLYPELDGTYPHHEADPVVEKNMADVKKLLANRAELELGLGLDGDCDRMAAMTKGGYLIPGDKLLTLLSKPILEQYPGAVIIGDIKTSAGALAILKQWGAQPSLSATGHSIIKAEMIKQGALLAGELSCHFCFKDRYFGYDDGIYAALRLFELLHTTGQPLDTLLSCFPTLYTSPEIRITCAEALKKQIVTAVTNYFAQQKHVQLITLDGVRVTFDHGWGLLRASNTQPALSARFESDSSKGLSMIQEDFMKALQPYFERDFLYHTFMEWHG
jgi:phosphomannomutase/phosphoglucomutase